MIAPDDFLRRFQSEVPSLVTTSDIFETARELLQLQFPGFTFHLYRWMLEKGRFASISEDSNLEFFVYEEEILWLSDFEDVLYCKEELLTKLDEEAELICRRLEAQIVLPISMNRALMGFVSIQGRGVQDLVDKSFWKDIRTTISASAANATLYERLEQLNASLERKVQERTRELEETQATLVHNEKLASLGTLAAGVAHEINTPSAVIQNGIESIAESLPEIFQFLLDKLSVTNQAFGLIWRILQAPSRRALSSKEKFLLGKEIKEQLRGFGIEDSEQLSRLSSLALELQIEEELHALATLSYEETLLVSQLFTIFQSLRNVLKSSNTIIRIVKSLKQYTYAEAGEREEVHIEEGIENTLTILRNEIKHGYTVTTDYSATRKVNSYPGELNQIWTNIILNAIQAMKGSGNITIRTFDEDLSVSPTPGTVYYTTEFLTQGAHSSPWVCVRIADNGPGIPREIRQKIFDPFFTTKAPGDGTGLGLGIVKNIVQKHNGFIYLHCEDSGTEFQIYLPAD